MKTVKVSELSVSALDWAVAKSEGWGDWDWDDGGQPGFHSKNGEYGYALFLVNYSPSSSWEQGGPIIDTFGNEESSFCLFFSPYDHVHYGISRPWKAEFKGISFWADTPLVAAMRCYVASKFGEEIEIPSQLIA